MAGQIFTGRRVSQKRWVSKYEQGCNHSVNSRMISQWKQRVCSDVRKWEECGGRTKERSQWRWGNDLWDSPSTAFDFLLKQFVSEEPPLSLLTWGSPEHALCCKLTVMSPAFLFGRCTVMLSLAGWSPSPLLRHDRYRIHLKRPSAKFISFWRQITVGESRRADRYAFNHM